MPTASMKLYYENPVGCLYEHPDGFALFRFRSGKRKFSELQGLLTHVRNLLELKGWHRFLADQTLLAPFTTEEVAWIVNHWRTAADEYPEGLYGAVVLAEDVFTRLAMGQVLHQVQGTDMHFRRFGTEAEALEWLRQRQ